MDYATRQALATILGAIEELTEYGELKVLGDYNPATGDTDLNEYGQELERALAIVRNAQGGN